MVAIKRSPIVVILLSLCIFYLFGGAAFSADNQRRPNGPPPEAYTACEGLSEGDEAQFVNPLGETVTGVCVSQGDRLVLRPDQPKDGSGHHRDGPPPEAYTACEGLSEGDEALFVGPRGKTVTGTCEWEGDKLVLRPYRP